MSQKTVLRFDGSLWCNLDIALRKIDQFFRQNIRPEKLSVIEWYILRALFEKDGQHASELAQAVGRAATSFTPNLDKLENKGFVERRPDRIDRRAVRIYLTDAARKHEDAVLESAREIDSQIALLFPNGDLKTFNEVVSALQTLEAG